MSGVSASALLLTTSMCLRADETTAFLGGQRCVGCHRIGSDLPI